MTFPVARVYGCECILHIHTFAMIGIIVVGDDPSSHDAIKQATSETSPKQRERFEAIFARLEGG